MEFIDLYLERVGEIKEDNVIRIIEDFNSINIEEFNDDNILNLYVYWKAKWENILYASKALDSFFLTYFISRNKDQIPISRTRLKEAFSNILCRLDNQENINILERYLLVLRNFTGEKLHEDIDFIWLKIFKCDLNNNWVLFPEEILKKLKTIIIYMNFILLRYKNHNDVNYRKEVRIKIISLKVIERDLDFYIDSILKYKFSKLQDIRNIDEEIESNRKSIEEFEDLQNKLFENKYGKKIAYIMMKIKEDSFNTLFLFLYTFFFVFLNIVHMAGITSINLSSISLIFTVCIWAFSRFNEKYNPDVQRLIEDYKTNILLLEQKRENIKKMNHFI